MRRKAMALLLAGTLLVQGAFADAYAAETLTAGTGETAEETALTVQEENTAEETELFTENTAEAANLTTEDTAEDVDSAAGETSVSEGLVTDAETNLTSEASDQAEEELSFDDGVDFAGEIVDAEAEEAAPETENAADEETTDENISDEEVTGEDTAGDDAAGEDTAGEDTVGEDTTGEDTVGEDTVAETESGTCGDHLTWTLADGIMTISGTGDMTTAPEPEDSSTVQQVVIKEGVTSIGNSAFYGCENLKNVNIPESVTSIGDYAFGFCSALAEITIPDGITSIGVGTFKCCEQLKEIEIPEGVTSIGEEAFYKCYDLTKVVIPSGVTSIGEKAFYRCYDLKELVIPASVTEIGDDAFSGCSFKRVENKSSIAIELSTKYDSVESVGWYVSDDWCWYCVESNTALEADSPTIANGTAIKVYTKLNGPYDHTLCVGEQFQCTAEIESDFAAELPAAEYTWTSSDESVAVVSQDGTVTMKAMGKTAITLTTNFGTKSSVWVWVASEKVQGTVKGDITWYIPEKIKLGYRVHFCSGECPGTKIAEVQNLPEDSLGRLLHCSVNSATGWESENFSSAHAGDDCTQVSALEDFTAVSVIETAVYPGTVELQLVLIDNQGSYSQNFGEPYTVVIEEPEISTNAPQAIQVGKTLDLAVELKNTALENELVAPYKNLIENGYDINGYHYQYDSHDLVYEPQITIEEGADLVQTADGDFSHTLTASEKLTFTGEGTVKIKIRFQALETCMYAGNEYSPNFYCPETTITIQVQKDCPHQWSEWNTTQEATTQADGNRQRTCSVCGTVESETIPRISATPTATPTAAPTITVPSKSFPLKRGQKFTLKVSNLLPGDSIASVTSSNKKAVKVKKTGKTSIRLTAPKKAKGKATITITTVKGARQTVTVKIQKKTVTTKKITGISKKLTMKTREKRTLTAVLTPISSQQKITYKSSNKKVVTVSSKGVLTAKKPGTATITIKSGRKTVKCKVTVKKK